MKEYKSLIGGIESRRLNFLKLYTFLGFHRLTLWWIFETDNVISYSEIITSGTNRKQNIAEL